MSFLDVALIVEGSHRDLPALALVRDSAVKVYCPCKFLESIAQSFIPRFFSNSFPFKSDKTPVSMFHDFFLENCWTILPHDYLTNKPRLFLKSVKVKLQHLLLKISGN